MPTTSAVGNVEERLVSYWLADSGYSTNIDTKAPDSTIIEGRGNSKSLLVQVKSAVQPNIPSSLTPEEVGRIISRAASFGFEPWEARVQLDEQMNR